MPIDIKKEIGSSLSITLVMPNETYIKNMNIIAKQLCEAYNKVCYVSLNKLYQPLIEDLQANNIDIHKIYFIDGITKKAVSNPGNVPNCFFASGPDKITELGTAIQKIVNQQKSQALLFDSLSTLLIYKNVQVVKQFVHSIVGQVSVTNCVAAFTCLQGKNENSLIQDLSMLVDNIVHIKD